MVRVTYVERVSAPPYRSTTVEVPADHPIAQLAIGSEQEISERP